MAHIITAVAGSDTDLRSVKTALLSVSDKRGLVDLGKALVAAGVQLLSTGGTAKSLRDGGLPVTDVSDHTGFPEIMDGRVKTLHPKIHGGLLGVRGNAVHEADMARHGITAIDLVVVNLYAFGATVAKGGDFDTCIENIDIGGPSMIRSAAKNNAAVAVTVSPDQYPELIADLAAHGGSTTRALRRRFAAAAFAHTAAYDAAIGAWFAGQVGGPAAAAAPATAAGAAEAAAPSTELITRCYVKEVALKYGCNPHQNPAFVGRLARAAEVPRGLGLVNDGGEVPGSLPFAVLNGTPGYINLLDAANAYQLAAELRAATGLAAAASFKHVSPAGAAVAVPLNATLSSIYEYDEAAGPLTPVALAYLRARSADPMCSFGDFAAVSDVVDEATARILKPEVSDGIVAPGFTPEALAILRTKKGGAFIILQAAADYKPPAMEYREVYGMMFAQRRNDALVTPESVSGEHVVTGKHQTTTAAAAAGEAAPSDVAASSVVMPANAGEAAAPSDSSSVMPANAVRDLVVALIAIKYTQSNSVGYALDGQMVGVGAGQQSRVDCVKLAGRKVATWWLRQHPKVRALAFKPSVKRQARVNARVRYIEGDMAPAEHAEWVGQFEAPPEPLTAEDKAEWLAGLTGVSLASDAFFPFRDSLDTAAKFGVRYVAQPGGSVADAEVTRAADEYGMVMAHNKLRLFHH